MRAPTASAKCTASGNTSVGSNSALCCQIDGEKSSPPIHPPSRIFGNTLIRSIVMPRSVWSPSTYAKSSEPSGI